MTSYSFVCVANTELPESNESLTMTYVHTAVFYSVIPCRL